MIRSTSNVKTGLNATKAHMVTHGRGQHMRKKKIVRLDIF